MDATETTELLRRVPLLIALSDSNLELLAERMFARELGVGEILCHEGDPGASMAIVIRGQMTVQARGQGDDEVTLGTVYPAETVGEMACVDPAPRAATVVATATTTLLILTRAAYEELSREIPAIGVGFRTGIVRELAARLRDTNARIDAELERRGLPLDTEAPPLEPRERLEHVAASGRVDLREVECLSGFTDSELKTLVAVAPPMRYPAGHVLCRQGEVATCAWLLARGAVDVFHQLGRQEHFLATLTSGTFIGQIALVDGSPRSANLVVKQPSVILKIERPPFEALLEDLSPFATRLQEQIVVAGTRQLRFANIRLAELLVSDPGYVRAATHEWSLELESEV